jgi:hypothetical protein
MMMMMMMMMMMLLQLPCHSEGIADVCLRPALKLLQVVVTKLQLGSMAGWRATAACCR